MYPAQDNDYISLIREAGFYTPHAQHIDKFILAQVHTVTSYMANPAKEGLQLMFIILTVYKYNINNGLIVPLLDDYMPKTSSAQLYSSSTGTFAGPATVYEVYTKRSISREHQSLVLLRTTSDMAAFSMGPEEEGLARILFGRYSRSMSCTNADSLTYR